jgi:hypothetical protein
MATPLAFRLPNTVYDIDPAPRVYPMLGIIQLSPALAMPIHSVGAIVLVWFLHRVSLAPTPTIAPARQESAPLDPVRLEPARHDVANCLSELGVHPAGPDTRACINLAVAERRRDRRETTDVPVYIFDDFGFCQGRVLNKSQGGLCIAAESNVTVGQSIRIQCQLHSNPAASVELEVCHVRKEGEEWIYGCKFVQDQDEAVLKLFG